MPKRSNEDINKIFDLFADSKEELLLNLLEMCGNLVMMFHWQRGIIDGLVQDGVIKFSGERRQNWDRVIKNLEQYEEFTWETSPARAFLLVMRHFRLTGELPKNTEKLNLSDTHGRIPYRLETSELDDIEDIIRKLKDARELTKFGHANNL